MLRKRKNSELGAVKNAGKKERQQQHKNKKKRRNTDLPLTNHKRHLRNAHIATNSAG